MKLTIFAATGGIGRHLLEQAVAAGHQATAVVRNPSKLAGQAVGIVIADLAAADPAVLESAAAGADAVLSGLGPRSTSQTCPAGSLGSTGRATTPMRRVLQVSRRSYRIPYGAAARRGGSHAQGG
jgi:putative NADH-flavin reductase